jgi:hypothetical protein
MAEGSDTDADALRGLEERLDRAAAAAERLFGDAGAAAGNAAGGGDRPRVPPAGWQQPASDDESARSLTGVELELLLGLLAALRDRIPPELQRRLADAVREVLLAVRALIDWYLERSERHPAEPHQVQDIPIL